MELKDSVKYHRDLEVNTQQKGNHAATTQMFGDISMVLTAATALQVINALKITKSFLIVMIVSMMVSYVVSFANMRF